MKMMARYPIIEVVSTDTSLDAVEVLEGPSRGAQFFLEDADIERFYEEYYPPVITFTASGFPPVTFRGEED